MVRLAALPVPARGRRAEHGPLGLADVLRPGPLSVLRPDPATLGDLRARRSIDGRRDHVGARLGRVSVAPCSGSASRLLFGRRRAEPDGRARCRGETADFSFPIITARRVAAASRRGFDAPATAGPRADSCAGDMPASRSSSSRRALPAIVIVDGLFGPQVAAMNLAGVLPWIHWRGFLILGLLVGGQRVVHGLPVPAAPDARPPLASRAAPLAAAAAEQVAGRRPARPVPLVVRGILALGQPMVDGLDRDRLLRRGLRDRRPLPRRLVLQVRLPDRPVQLRAVARSRRWR